jgi:hypothetical protein
MKSIKLDLFYFNLRHNLTIRTTRYFSPDPLVLVYNKTELCSNTLRFLLHDTFYGND